MTAILAAGLWTKLYFLLLLPSVLLASWLAPGGAARRRAPLVIAVGLLLLLPWAIRQKSQTGDWLGLYASRQATSLAIGLPARLAAFPDVVTSRFAIVFGRTFLWPGTRSSSGAPAAVAVALTATLAVIAFAPWLSRGRASRVRMRSWWAGGFAALLFVGGQLAYASTYAAVGRARGRPAAAGPDGWYLLLLFPVILTAGCALGRAVRPRFFVLAAGVFILAEALMTFGVLPGVYAGRTGFNGANVPLTVYAGQLFRPAESLRAYARVGPAAIPAAGLALLAAVWLLLLLAGMFLAARSRPRGGADRRA